MTLSKTQAIIVGVVLFLSLAANMAIIGGAMFHGKKFQRMAHSSDWIATRLDRGETRLLRHLEGDDKETARAIIATRRPALEGAMSGLVQSRREIRKIIRDDSRDLAEITEKLEQSEGQVGVLNANLHALLRDLLRDISPEGRQALADQLRDHRRHRRNRHRRD